MTLEQPDNLEGKKDTMPDAVAASPAAEAEHGAVKKKIDIPGVGEIEYTEKRIMFPEKIVQETGGVKGYIRKMVSWEELASFWNISENEVEKIRTGRCHPESYLIEKSNFEKSNFYKTEGIKSILLALTNGEFINQTLNHVINRGGGGHPSKVSYEADSVLRDKMIEKIRIEHDKNLFDLDSNKFNEAKKSKNVYIQSHWGFNLTNPGKLWSGYWFNGEYDASIPHIGHIILGLKLDTRNVVLRKYCSSVLKLIEEQDGINSNPRRYAGDLDYRGFNETTLKAILNPVFFQEDDNKKADTVVDGSQESGWHPYLPIVINHPDIPELRWCHADYAAIPTKNGYNIIEMIT